MKYAEIMRFSDKEMICFNSILGGGHIVGLDIKIPLLVEKDSYIQDTVNRLKEKRFVDQNGKINHYGAFPVKLLDFYKKATSYVFLNGIKIGLVDKDNVVVLERTIEGTTITPMKKIVLMAGLISEFPKLKESQEKMAISDRELIAIKQDEWLDTLDDLDEKSSEILAISKYDKEKYVCKKMYYWDKDNTYLYDIDRHRRKKVGSVDIRTDIMRQLELGGEYYGER